MKLTQVVKSNRKNKKLKAVFTLPDNSTKSVHFGTDSNYVFNKNKTNRDRENYISRHSQNPLEKAALKNKMSPARLSMDLLWGKSRSLQTNIKTYKKKYGL